MNRKFGILLIGIILFSWISCNEDTQLPPIIDPVILPIVNVDDIYIVEGDELSDVAIAIHISIVQDTAVAVSYHTVDDTAIDGEDYISSSGTAIIPAHTQYLDIYVETIGDKTMEELEQFFVILDSNIGSSISRDTVIVTIEDDDSHQYNYPGYITPIEYNGYNLVWADEFEGEILNTDNWVHEIGTGCPNICGWGNNELEYYRAENTVVGSDLLTITAQRENFSGSNYTSSRIKSQNNQTFKYGRVDIRARLPFGQGLWPALWMLGTNINEVGWPACGEIDIMELKGEKPDEMSCTVHYKNSNNNHQYVPSSFSKLIGSDYSEEFHVFSIIWNDQQIKWYRDDMLIKTVTHASLNVSTEGNPFQRDFFFIMNVAVGGNFVQNPNASTPFPQTMEVDYFRVFQEIQLKYFTSVTQFYYWTLFSILLNQ